ncbi:hypothetical protein L596_026686 [Steinernema carpocapsae]|uniref:Uncharacterized protein n=1 Tax=Steinernema carpocapsae TaxID=34508 RepID=A0A4U5M230_STECR|nr:hypothetical protein L596_026686 [Steinernema carpocapsae]
MLRALRLWQRSPEGRDRLSLALSLLLESSQPTQLRRRDLPSSSEALGRLCESQPACHERRIMCVCVWRRLALLACFVVLSLPPARVWFCDTSG